MGAEGLARLYGQQYTYGFGGGTIGGDIWNIRQPTSMEMLYGKREPIVELKPEYRGKVNVTPAGRGSAQELRGMREAGGRPYVEAPELYRRGSGKSQLDKSGQFYSTVTGRPMGTFMGTGSYGGFGMGGIEPTGPRNPDYGSNPRKRAMAEAAQQGSALENSSSREGYVRNRLGYLEPQKWYNKDGTKMTESEYQKSKSAPAMPAQNDSWRFSLLGGGPMLNWPYTNY